MSGRSRIVDFDQERLKKYLAEIYQIQMRNCLPDEIMAEAMKKLSLSDETAIDLIRTFIDLGWIRTGSTREKFFLRPGYVQSFPLIISSEGLDVIR